MEKVREERISESDFDHVPDANLEEWSAIIGLMIDHTDEDGGTPHVEDIAKPQEQELVLESALCNQPDEPENETEVAEKSTEVPVTVSENGRTEHEVVSVAETENSKPQPGERELEPFTESELMSLYFNQELYNSEMFVSEFVEHEIKSGRIVQLKLYELLTCYLVSRDSLYRNSLTFNSEIRDYSKFQDELWHLQTAMCTEWGECEDGNAVSATHTYKIAHFNQIAFDNLSHVIAELQNFTSESYILSVFNVQLYKIKVESYIQSLCSCFSYLPHTAPVTLHCDSSPREPLGADYRHIIKELRDAVSVLFSFQRRPIKDDGFISETRAWLEKLLGVLLRVASPNDHLFILHHVLRCPSGVSKWASCFIQAPTALSFASTYNQQYLDHLITSLASILLPVKDREFFLQQMTSSIEDNGAWVVIDSDIEDSIDDSVSELALKEKDLISLMNQIPVGDIFRQILLVNRRQEQDVYDVNMVTDRDLLRAIAVSTLFVTLLERGLVNFSPPIYKQFCRRLCMFVKHTALYLTDHWQIFRDAYLRRSIVDSSMMLRLQTEYDAFLLRVAHSLYMTQNRIGWQYLATLPFGMITSQTLWRLYQHLLHTNSDAQVVTSDEFIDIIENLPDDDIYYFLTTVTNMALSRQQQDWIFIQTVTSLLFQVGFVNASIRDNCMKSCRIMLSNLTSKHPSLISGIILALKKEFSFIGKFSVYLFKELPLYLWKPTPVDVSVIGDWLLTCSLLSWENSLARYIITQLNWSTDINERELFLPRELHAQVAVMIAKAVMLYAEEIPNPYGVPQVPQMLRSVQTPEQGLTTWAWQILPRLRIHLIDQSNSIVFSALHDPTVLSIIPDINSSSVDMQTLSNGITRRQSIACYVALLASNVGHSIPVIIEKGFECCSVLLSSYRYSHVLHVLQLILPYFFDSPTSLSNSQQFRRIMFALLSADRTYMKVAKSYITTEFPGDTLLQIAALIEYQLCNHSRYGLQNASQIVELWLRVLSSVWNEDSNSVSFLMDRVLFAALFNADLKTLATTALAELVQIVSQNSVGSQGGLSSLFSWMSITGGKTELFTLPMSLLPQTLSTIAHSPYFTYFAIILEEHSQIETQLWPELLKTLASSSGKANIDNALKKTCYKLKLSLISSSSLAIYRWCEYALALPMDHPIMPLLWQRFFRLYLQRVPSSVSRGSVGMKFFEGTINGSFQNKLKKKLQQCAEYADKKETENSGEKEWFKNLAMLYKTYILWLEEMHLHEAVLYLPSLPSQCNPQKLELVLDGDAEPWLEFVDFEKIRSIQKNYLSEWDRALYRGPLFQPRNILTASDENPDAAKRILNRLQSYDTGIPPPPLIITHVVVPSIPLNILVKKTALLDHLSEYFKILTQYTQSYKIEWDNQRKISEKLLETLKHLYVEIVTETPYRAACDVEVNGRRPQYVTCAGPALIRVKVAEVRKNPAYEDKVEKLNKEFQRLSKHNVRTPPFKFTVACIVLENVAENLKSEKNELARIGDQMLLSSVYEVGISLFYKMAYLYNTEVANYFPTKQLIGNIVQLLGEAFIRNNENECSRLLKTCMQNPSLSSLFLPHFNPAATSTANFIRSYETVLSTLSPDSAELTLNVIEKFVVTEWLNHKKPKLNERSRFIQILCNALKELGISPLAPLLPVHKVLRTHLCKLLLYEFPEHYGEMLHIMLKYSEEEKFSCDIWFDLLNALVISASCSGVYTPDDVPFRPGLSSTQIKDIARQYAAKQRTLTYHELIETANMLGNHFLRERLNYGLYGLYPKYGNYLDPLLSLHSLVGHASIASMLQMQRGTLADKMCEQIWPTIVSLFSPWLLPYFTSQLNEPTAPWIEQLMDDRSVLLPWVPEDGPLAFKMMTAFTECLRFVLEALPASNVILQCVCQWYIIHFAHQSIGEHILTIVHHNLLTLPWSRFHPATIDVEAMLKIVDQYLPLCHAFLGSIFLETPWHVVVNQDAASPLGIRTHVALLHLLVKFGNEASLRQGGKISTLLIEAQHYAWNLVDADSYERVVNWFVENYKPRVILLMTDEDWNASDVAVLELLQVAAGYVAGNTMYHPTTQRKRQMFIRACVMMMLRLSNTYKNVISTHSTHLANSICKMLDKMEFVISTSVPIENRCGECGVLLGELLMLVNQSTNSGLMKLSVQALIDWLKHKAGNSIVLKGLLQVAGHVITDPVQLGIILEASISAWFKNSAGMEEYDWDKVLDIVSSVAEDRYPVLEESLVANSQVLTLYTLTLKQLQTGHYYSFSLSKVIDWIMNLKPSSDIESKLVLLWSLMFKECEKNKSEVIPCLMKFSVYLQQLAQLKQGWAIFNVMNLKKQIVPSIKCRVLCRATNAFVLAKLITEKEELSREYIPWENADTTGNNTRYCVPSGSESMKAVIALDELLADKHCSEYKVTVTHAIDLIKSSDVTLYQGEHFVITLAKQLYTDGFIHAFPSDTLLAT